MAQMDLRDTNTMDKHSTLTTLPQLVSELSFPYRYRHLCRCQRSSRIMKKDMVGNGVLFPPYRRNEDPLS